MRQYVYVCVCATTKATTITIEQLDTNEHKVFANQHQQKYNK